MRFFLDTEFYDADERGPGGDGVQLISVGVVTESGDEFYAISSEYDTAAVAADAWLSEHVVPHLKRPDAPPPVSLSVLADALAAFFHRYGMGRGDELWAYNGVYDFFLVSRLWGGGLNAARAAGMPSRMFDVKQAWLAAGQPPIPVQDAGAHDALADARHDRDIWVALHPQLASEGL